MLISVCEKDRELELRPAHQTTAIITTMKVEGEDDNDSSDDDSVECLKLFLGGIDPGDIAAAADLEKPQDVALSAGARHSTIATLKNKSSNRNKDKVEASKLPGLDDYVQVDNEDDWNTIFSLAHHVSSQNDARPPVRVVQIPGRGNALVATRHIRKGDVLFTERAAFASQTNEVMACQKCYRSLEAPPEGFPLQEQWNRVDIRYCERCQASFCSLACQQKEDCCAFAPRSNSNAAIQLAIKMFHNLLRKHRSAQSTTDWTRGLCGTSSDCSQLDLDNVSTFYNDVAQRWDMTMEESSVLSLECFERLVAAACRNSFGIRTQSPFKPYHAAVLRQCGRNSKVHCQLQQAIADLLAGSSTEQENILRHGMDREMDERFAPEIVCLFTLISRINHSCDPNAQVISQAFVDYHVDIVALKDIRIGEEVLISYLPPMKRPERRKAFLKARFLFDCNCSACRSPAD